MERNEMLKQATLLFLQNGYEQYTTKKLATEIGVGKNTIYKTFGNKENLLGEVLKTRKDIIYKKAEEARNQSNNAIENYFLLRTNIIEVVSVLQQRVNLLGLKKSYPKLYKKAVSDIREMASICCEAVFIRGLKEGVFSKLNSQSVGDHYGELILTYRVYKKYKNEQEIIQKNQEIELIFLKGLLSKKGAEILDKIGNPYEKHT